MPILGITASSLSGNLVKYWVGYIAGPASAASQNEYIRGITTDSSGNIYCVGNYRNASGYNVEFVAKYNSAGTIQWSRSLTGTSTTPSNFGYAIALDSSNNVYVGGSAYTTGGVTNASIVKYNSSGTLQWQRALNTTITNQEDIIRGVATDSSSNVYVVGYQRTSDSQSYKRTIILKYNSSGTLQWQRSFGVANSLYDYGYAIAVDSSANVYIASACQEGTYTAAYLAKYNTSGTIQWQRKLYVTNPQDETLGVALDSSGNIYICGKQLNSGAQGYVGFVAKYNSSGTIQWQRTLTNALSSAWQDTWLKGIYLDSSSNVYIQAYDQNTAAGGSFGTFLFKYNSSGTLQWQRRIIDNNATPSNAGRNVGSIWIDSNNYIILGSSFKNSSGGTNALVARLPSDGSLTGTYAIDANHTIIYGTPSYTDAAGGATDAAGTSTDAAGNENDNAGSVTDASVSLTTAKVNI